MNRFIPVVAGGVVAVVTAAFRHRLALVIHGERKDNWSEYRKKHTHHRLATETVRVLGSGPVRLGIYNVETGRAPGDAIRSTASDTITLEAKDGQHYLLRRGAFLRIFEVDGMRDIEVSPSTRGIEVDPGTEVKIYAQWPNPTTPGEAVPLLPAPMHPKASPRVYISGKDPEVVFQKVLREYDWGQTPKPWGVLFWVLFTCLVAAAVSMLPGAAANLAAVFIWLIALTIGEGSRWHELITRE